MTKATTKATTRSTSTNAGRISGTSSGRSSSRAEHLSQTPQSAGQKRQILEMEAPEGVDMDALAAKIAAHMRSAEMPAATQSQGVNEGFARVQDAKCGPSTGNSMQMSTQLMKVPPVEGEINSIALNLETVHSLITDLFSELNQMLAHEEVGEREGDCNPSRPSESPLHRRLIDQNDTLETIIARLRHLKSRIRC